MCILIYKRHFYYPKSKNVLCSPKKEGGLGFKKFEDINKSLLAKLAWKVSIEPKSLWVKCLLAKYLKQKDFLNAPNAKGSWVWGVFKWVRN